MVKIFKILFCKKHDFILKERYYGDMKNIGAGVYVCKKCGKLRIF
jgi:hypothetical protein